MISTTIQGALNNQIKDEFESAYLYLSMSAHCFLNNMQGFGHWLRMQAQEELQHGMRLFDYLLSREGEVVLQAVEKPSHTFESLKELYRQVLDHERQVTKNIHRLYEMVIKESDYASQIELQWFITEQVEEERVANEILQQLEMLGDNKSGLLMLDKELGARGTAH